MAKHRRREQEPVRNNNANNNVNNNPFGIDPMQLMNLLGGNFDMNSMLKSMNTNGFNLANLEPLAKMAGINLGSNGMFNNMNQSPNMNGNMNGNMNNGFNSNVNGTNENVNRSNDILQEENITDINQMSDAVDIDKQKVDKTRRTSSKKESSKKQEKVVMDENLKFLMTLKTYIHPDRAEFIDKVIDLYNKGIFK